MKFIHIADVHLGMTPDKGKPWSEERRQELMSSFADIIRICEQTKIDLLLIAGDLFHKQPLLRELKEVSALFDTIPDTNVVLIAGNHDYITGMSHYNTFTWGSNVTFLSGEQAESVYLEDIGTEVCGFSFHTREIHEPKCDGLRPRDPGHINILLAHGGDPSNNPINAAALASSGFDYVALGHIHKPQEPGTNIRYAGSLEPLDRNETEEHGYVYGEAVREPGAPLRLETRFVPHAVREYIRADVTADRSDTTFTIKDKVARLIEERGPRNIYSVTVTGFRDPDIVFDTAVIETAGNIAAVSDRTEPDYDFDGLMADNPDNIIGMYIKRIAGEGSDPDITRRALYYGLEALLK